MQMRTAHVHSNGVLEAIGNTPLVKLNRLFDNIDFQLFAKLEALNPGGSMKDRPAFNIIKHAMESGDLEPGAVVIESSSGNMGIGLAQACLYFGLRFICIVDPKTTAQNIRLLKAYGAEIDLVSEPDPITGEFLKARLDRVRELAGYFKNGFWPNQYANEYNPKAHRQTMQEIVTALDGRVDYVFCATSTCGTMRGCAEYVRQQQLDTKVYAVDAVGSVIFGGPNAKRLVPGHGASVRPALYQPGLADNCVYVTDLDCIIGCHRLVKREAILAGGSSGAIVMALDQIKDEIPSNANCVAIFADRGERYLDTIYSPEWVEEHFGDIQYLLEEPAMSEDCMAALV